MTTPNYKKNVGRLVLDRYDFENHVQGSDFNHTADTVNLKNTLTVNGNPTSTVENALIALNNVVTPPTITDATSSVKGILKLTGDFGGTASIPKVIGLQGIPVNILPPNDGDVLAYDSLSTSWKPTSSVNSFVAGGDLAGNNVSQQVIALSGTSNEVSVYVDNLKFNLAKTPNIYHDSAPSGNGKNFFISAQSATLGNTSGGSVVISGGNNSGTGQKGGVKLRLNTTNVVQALELSGSRRILSLMNPSDTTSSDMPLNTGDMVIYIKDTSTPPTSGNPNNGSILYSYGSQLWVKQGDGNNFRVGEIPNPSYWGSGNSQTISYRFKSQTTSSTPNTVLSYTVPQNSSIRVDIVAIGKKNGNNSDSAQYNLSLGFTRLTTAPAAVGTLTIADQRTLGNGSLWSAPDIVLNGNDVEIKTGSYTSTTINWFLLVQIAISGD
jgi:hypothetical protein